MDGLVIAQTVYLTLLSGAVGWLMWARQNRLEREIIELRKEMKADNAALRVELKAEIGEVRTELKADLKAEIGGLRQEMHAEVGGLRGEMKSDIGGLREEIAWLRSDMTHIALAVGADLPRAGEARRPKDARSS